MSNPSIPAAVARPVPPCPPWCDPKSCERTEADVWHRSVPVRFETLDAEYDFALVRTDELAFPREWGGAPRLQLFVTSKSLAVGEVGDAPLYVSTDLSLAELPGLIDALAGQLWRGGGHHE